MAVFEASPEGFRAMNLGRPAAHLVRELVQNVLDEAAETCHVDVKWTPKKGIHIRVTDDLYGGIREERLIFTIWESDKQDSPTKRGRMGRGLKEMVSVSDWTSVATQGRPTTLFERSPNGDWSRKTTKTIPSPTVGTIVETQVKAWGERDAEEIVKYLKSIRAPKDMVLFVNGEEVKRKPHLEAYNMRLSSVVFTVENNERRVSNSGFQTVVELFPEAEPKIYEMGLPIETIDFPLSIDVQQRIPLREQRDTLVTWYRVELFAKLLSARIDHMPTESLRDNYVLKAAEGIHYLSDAAMQKIANAWTEGKPYAASPQMMSVATGQHVQVVNLRTLPEAIRDLVKKVGTDVKQVLRERQTEFCPQVEPTYEEKRLINCWEWIAEGINKPCVVVVAAGKPNAEASFDRSGNILTIYKEVLGEDFFRAPLKVQQLGLLIHELAHWKIHEESHGANFHSDAENVGAAVAVFLMENYYEATQKGSAI